MIGCASEKSKCGNRALILWPNSKGEYGLREMVARTLSSLADLDGPVAKVFYENRLGGSGFDGRTARPQLTDSGDVCIPQNTDSAAVVSAYLQFEHLQRFERRLGTLGMLSWPRTVGVDIHLRTSDGSTHNNATYDGNGDLIASLPYSLNGVPASMNLGVVAHEHFHAHFHKQVMLPMNRILLARGFGARAAEDLAKANRQTAAGLNAFVLRGWNEGLADFYAGVYSGDPDYIGKTWPADRAARSLSAALANFDPPEELERMSANGASLRSIMGYGYRQGSILARLLYAMGGEDARSREALLAHILKRLADVPTSVEGVYMNRVLAFEEILPVLLSGLEMSSTDCEILSEVLTTETLQKGFAECSVP